MKIESNIFIS